MLRDCLTLNGSALREINDLLVDRDNGLVTELLRIVQKYGDPAEINSRASDARHLSNILARLRNMGSPYLKDIEWLISERDKGAFTSMSVFREKVLGPRVSEMLFNEGTAVTLEISALQYFPWLIAEAQRAIDHGEIMPGRYIRVRKMKEQEEDQGDILAVAAAMQVLGASYVETMDTKGTDGSNVHLGGPETITGYFGGVGQPNEHALMWADEYLYYYTNYGINQALNVNPGTILIGYMLYRLGIDIKFKISVFTGNDNPFSVLWTLMMARLMARDDGSTPLEGLNLSNSVSNRTIEQSSEIRRKLGLETQVRIEHHITETYKSIVRQPYNRREELLDVAALVPNISAKHEGGDPDSEANMDHPSDLLDYFRSKEEIIAAGDMERLERNYLCKHEALNRTAWALTERGLSFIAARRLHRR